MLYRRLVNPILPALALAAGIACAVPAMAQQTVIIAPSAPPAPQVETIPPAPTVNGQPAYWTPGHWSWTASGWAWVGGTYVTPPQPTAQWVPGQWVTQPNGGFMWVAGHWQS